MKPSDVIYRKKPRPRRRKGASDASDRRGVLEGAAGAAGAAAGHGGVAGGSSPASAAGSSTAGHKGVAGGFSPASGTSSSTAGSSTAGHVDMAGGFSPASGTGSSAAGSSAAGHGGVAGGFSPASAASSSAGTSGSKDAYLRYVGRKRVAVISMAALLIVVALWSISIGAREMSLVETISAVIGFSDQQDMVVVWNLRMPRVLAAIVGGIALSLAGCAFQATLRNPLASASTLGVSQGAAMGASIAIIFFGAGTAAVTEGTALSSNPYLTAICAFCGAMLSTLVILGLFRLREMTPVSIVLAGVALSALFTGVTTLIQYFADDSQVAAVVFWTFGDLSRVDYRQLALMAAVTLVSAIYFMAGRWNLNAIESGEVSAHGLGVDVRRTRMLGMLVASAAASCVIAFCGTINFIGLVAPHVMRRIIGSDYRFLLPASAFAGGVLLLLSDIIARTAMSPLILPISAITSFVGAPMFIYLLFKGVRR